MNSNCPFVLHDDKQQLFLLLSENNIDAAKELVLNSKRGTVFSDAGFYAIAANKPEFVDFLFDNLDTLEGAPLSELLKMASFATQPNHYSAFAKATKGKLIVDNRGFITDAFVAATWNDNAEFLNWLLDNDYTPHDNYHTDSKLTWTLLDVVGHLGLHKCVCVLMARNFKATNFRNMKDNSWSYPWPEEELNSIEIWSHITNGIEDNYSDEGFFGVSANWFSKMSKSDSNTRYAALALLQKHCTELDISALESIDAARQIAQEKGKIKDYLEKLRTLPFSELSKEDVIIHLFFNAPLLKEPSDIEHALDMLEDIDNSLMFHPLSNDIFCFALKKQTYLKSRLKEIEAMPFVRLNNSLQGLLNRVSDEDECDLIDLDDLDSIMPDEDIFLDAEPEDLAEDDSEEHF
ncbi:MAG: hypothetical protein CMN72_15940 [Sphingomonas sp.]|nr:hypothetical protein [Sphingomonas sp.]|tara:strand:- start:6150 stop:7364 length:1215 start_codon:yes stop_codon:yes gene_type:complete